MITDMSDSVLVDGVLCCFYDAAMLCFNHAMLQLLLCCYATLCCAMLLCYYCAIYYKPCYYCATLMASYPYLV